MTLGKVVYGIKSHRECEHHEIMRNNPENDKN